MSPSIERLKRDFAMISKGTLLRFRTYERDAIVFLAISDSYARPDGDAQGVDILDNSGVIRRDVWTEILEVISQ